MRSMSGRPLLQPLVHEIVDVADWMIVQHAEAFVAKPLVKRPRLKFERIEPDVFASARARLGLGGPHEFSPMPSPAILTVYPERADMEPSRQNSSDESALDFAAVGPQKNVDRYRGIRDASRIEVETMQPILDQPYVLNRGILFA